MIENIREKGEAELSSPTSDEVISEIKKWADSIPSFLGAEMYQPSKESILLGLGIDKDFDCDRISMRVISDFCPIIHNPMPLLTFYA